MKKSGIREVYAKKTHAIYLLQSLFTTKG